MTLDDVAQGVQISVQIAFSTRRCVNFVVEVKRNLQQIQKFIGVGDVLRRDEKVFVQSIREGEYLLCSAAAAECR